MKNLQKYLVLFILPMLLFVSACKEDSTTQPTPSVNEAEVLVQYLEANGDYLNMTAPAMITAADLRTAQLTNTAKTKIIDIRSAADFAKGRIEGAVNVTVPNIYKYVKDSIVATNYDKIAIACYSGQTAGYATALLRLLGYSNVYSLKWGMSAWNDSITASSWKANVGNNYTSFATDSIAKNAVGSLPTLSTGKTTGKEILEARVNTLLSSTDPFGDAKVAYGTVTGSLSSYYIVNYWILTHYKLGHIPGAIQYTPKADLKLSTYLKTLPTNKPVVIYCYTGQTSAQAATILKVLGYDAKTLLFGVSTMNYNLLVNNNLSTWKDTECMYYPFVK